MGKLSPAARLAQRKMIARAVELLQAGRFDQARPVLEAVLARWPAHPDALNFLGVLCHQDGDSAAALSLVGRAIDAAPGAPAPLNNLGSILFALHRYADAERAYRQCLLVQPDFADAKPNLAAVCARQGRLDEAAALYRECLARDPDNPVLRHHLAACSATDAVPLHASDAYVRHVFDRDAAQFDARLGGLAYQGPQRLEQTLARQLPPAAADLSIADLGCGTGLCGPLLRPRARRLVGCDLSAQMLARARERGVYDALEQARLQDFLLREPGAFDALACIDTLIYLGDLAPVFAAAAQALRGDGWLAFTCEALADDDGAPWRLQTSGRYAHGRAYLLASLAAAALRAVEIERFDLRFEAGHPVAGWNVFAKPDR